MKNIILTISILFIQYITFAQNTAGKSDDAARIALTTVVPEQVGGLTQEAKEVLKNKLNQISTKNGIGGSPFNRRFIITANVIELTKDISSTTPVIYTYNLEVTLYIGDGVEGTKFASYAISLKGSGNSEAKAYLMALKGLRPDDPKYSSFINDGKTKIMEYYNSKCDFIIKEAKTLESQNLFDESIYKLSGVPQVCLDCYNKCMDVVAEVFKAKMERECQKYIAEAKSQIAQNNYDAAAIVLAPILPDLKCYGDAQSLLQEVKDHRCAEALGKAKGAWASKDIEATSSFLTEIPTDSKCKTEAEAIIQEVKKWAKEKDNREWNLVLKQQQDETDIQKATIKAARDIGVAYGNNQPKTITYNYRGWW